MIGGVSRALAGAAIRAPKRLHPLRLPALQAWYTFDDPTYLYQDAAMTTAVASDGDPIGAVLDRSGNGRHCIQSTAGNRPTWKTNIKNGRAVARLDGGDWLANDAPGALLRNAAGATIVCVLQTSGDTLRIPVGILANVSTAARAQLARVITLARSVGLRGRRQDADSLQTLESTQNVFAEGEWGVQSVRVDYTARAVRGQYQRDTMLSSDTYHAAGNTSNTDSAGLIIGGGSLTSTATAIIGDEAEVIICGADIGEALLKRLWSEYLRPKWGVPA